jgi:sulfotransferase family protein
VSNPVRNFLHRYVSLQFNDPLGLLVRLIQTGHPAAYFAMVTAGLGIICTPLDMMLQVFENRAYKAALKPQLPVILVCGAPRTGTTLFTQVLINHLPVDYLNNVTSIFPRSPITANRLLRRFLRPQPLNYDSYYGKSLHFSGPNDALYIWDRWFGEDRTIIQKSMSPATQDEMLRFFGAYEQFCQKPVINKNNNLNTYAHVVADVFENAHFICMTRDPLYLAQSLLKARQDIHGNVHIPYGIDSPHHDQPDNEIESVCEQVLFHEQIIKEQQQLIGEDRFWIVRYEEFCQHPEETVKRVSEEILGQPVSLENLKAKLKPFSVSNKVKMDPAVFESLKQTFERMRHDNVHVASGGTL